MSDWRIPTCGELRAMRHAVGLTQTDVHDLIGVKQRTLSGYENGERQPPIDVARELITLYETVAMADEDESVAEVAAE